MKRINKASAPLRVPKAKRPGERTVRKYVLSRPTRHLADFELGQKRPSPNKQTTTRASAVGGRGGVANPKPKPKRRK